MSATYSFTLLFVKSLPCPRTLPKFIGMAYMTKDNNQCQYKVHSQDSVVILWGGQW
jgi:hypothetical protein